MESTTAYLRSLDELDARHDDLLERLDELDLRVAGVLKACLASGQLAGGQAAALKIPEPSDPPPAGDPPET